MTYRRPSYHLQIGFLATFLLLANLARAESCYKVELKKPVDEAKCEPIPTVVTIFDCGDSTKVIEEDEVQSTVNCKTKPFKLTTKYKDKSLSSDLVPAQLWGGINFKAERTSAGGGASAGSAVVAESKPSAVPRKLKKRLALASAAEPVVMDLPKKASGAATDPKVEQKVAEHKAPESKPAEEKAEAKGEAKPEETPVNIKVSGFAWVETERSSMFGYDGASGISNFDSSLDGSSQSQNTLMSNIQLDISKGPTTLTSVFEVGEVIDGESSTGGAQGARQKILEVRNMFLAHEFSANWAGRAGLINFASDPNAYILSDHHSALFLDYKSDKMTGSIWTAKAKEVKPGTLPETTPGGPVYPDTYVGLNLSGNVSESTKLTGYGVHRKTKESLNDQDAASIFGTSEYQWLGLTVDQGFNDNFSIQASGVSNTGKFKGEAADSASDTFSAYLADVKFIGSWKESGWDVLLEGLMTSGSTDGATTIGKRKGFVSPDPGAAYLLTIATSDGADDAPGNIKESVIGNLNQSEGLQIAVMKATKTFSDRLSGFVRYGYLRSANKNSVTESQEMGQEFDLSATYELSPGTLLQMDYGYFKPGAFYSKNDPAQLFTTRVKFSF